GVDWDQARTVFKVLLISPVIGFGCAALLLLVFKFAVRDPALYEAPKGDDPPPFWIRCLLILTCTGVSFGHGSNDGQKGMGLIMLILIGTVPTAYALNHAISTPQTADYVAVSRQADDVIQKYISTPEAGLNPRAAITDYIRTRQFTPAAMIGMHHIVVDLANEAATYRQLKS